MGMSDVRCDGAFNREDPSIDLGLHARDSDVGGFRWEGMLSAKTTLLDLLAELGIVFLSFGNF
jgi:hypothetical protein